jgi:hypothetical protein
MIPLTPEQAAFLLEARRKVAQIEELMRHCPAFCLMEIGQKIARSERVFRRIPRDFWKSRAFCVEAARRNGEALEWAHETVISEDFFRAAMEQDGLNLSYVPKQYKTVEVCLAAVKQNGLAIRSVPPLRLTREIVREAARQNPRALNLVGEEWREDL